MMWKERAFMVVLLLLVHKIHGGCPSSSCGQITNINYPFRFKGDPEECGEEGYELGCENNVTVLYLYSAQYHVQSINYKNYTVRVVDPALQHHNLSSLPLRFLSRSNFSDTYTYTSFYDSDPYQAGLRSYENWELSFSHIVFVNCNHSVGEKGKYVESGEWVKWEGKGYAYAIGGDLKAEDLEVGCEVKLVAPTSLSTFDYHSYSSIHTALAYGFQISWIKLTCQNLCPDDDSYCYFDSSNQKLQWWAYKVVFGLPFIIVIFTYKWRKRHMSMYGNIENYLEQNSLTPIRYSYKEIKKMAVGFKEKLGEGGFGSVFKAKLCSGPFVAIKMLGKSKANGQDFINEVATIGRIHHQNVVQLIGFCVSGSKRALVYEFMSNGSLDKFIFSKERNIHLSYEKIYNMSIGVARGITYLHHGCEMQILHFDIKPHNILLDENFIPKVSDFGLAKLYPIDNSIVTMIAARGTIGYMAPELFYKNIGGISHKADVYSFGMLLMEMASKRKNLNPHVDHSSQLYFPLWIYDHIEEEEDIDMEDLTEEKKIIAKKMIIVSLWCIQLKPIDRPSMNRVVEMLEGDIEDLEIPPKPTLFPNEMSRDGETINSTSNELNSFSYTCN
ncbi:LEAF RUST 10 DISEASE-RESISTANCEUS RECEPTOR-LIKE PROTEIN KINASE-like 2.1 isoform X2 [Phaseolus vulgaris]|uniref:LEAF RUST 10 DISEASE-RESISTANCEUS RECEPTOR-LIKE PROTEIN KINASE-like 2.1 isoform X2 n=1 Tax=Phaseolus vulgaris TaxID=3885 RepID=UPI0035C95B1A